VITATSSVGCQIAAPNHYRLVWSTKYRITYILTMKKVKKIWKKRKGFRLSIAGSPSGTSPGSFTAQSALSSHPATPISVPSVPAIESNTPVNLGNTTFVPPPVAPTTSAPTASPLEPSTPSTNLGVTQALPLVSQTAPLSNSGLSNAGLTNIQETSSWARLEAAFHRFRTSSKAFPPLESAIGQIQDALKILEVLVLKTCLLSQILITHITAEH
jgi:hypothetical protein